METLDPEVLHELEDICLWCNLVFWVPNGLEFLSLNGDSIMVCADCAEAARV
jgi:hypothetical protein